MENICEPRELKGSKLFGYSFGVIGQILPSTLINAYLFMFYTYTIGLDSLVVNLATGIATLINGLLAPVFGNISDNHRPGKFGKRKPFIMATLPIMILAFIIVWMPPIPQIGNSRDFTTSAFLFIFVTVYFINYPILRSSYLALLPELSTVRENRIKISGLQGIISIVGTILGILLPMFLQSRLENPREALHTTADGQFLLRILPIIAILFAIIAVVFTLWTLFSADESYYSKEECEIERRKIKMLDVFRELLNPFKDRNFSIFLIATLFMNAAMRILIKILTPYLTFVLEFQGNQFNIFTILLIPFAGVGFVYWQKSAKNKSLKGAFRNSTLLIGMALLLTAFLYIPIPQMTTWVITYVLIGLALSSMVAGYILPNPIIGSLVDSSNSEKANSGAYFGSWLLTLNVANFIGDLLIGVMLSGNETNPIILKAILPVTSILFFIAVGCIQKMELQK